MEVKYAAAKSAEDDVAAKIMEEDLLLLPFASTEAVAENSFE